MIHRFCRIALFTVTLLAWLPGVTYADGLISWLGKLSGPGPFIGANVDLCVWTSARSEGIVVMGSGWVISCPRSRLNQQHWNLYVTGGVGLALDNNLDYTGRDVSGVSERVTYFRVGSSLMYTVHPAIDLGAGGGVLVFNGPRFDAFSMPYLQIVKLGVRPLLIRNNARNTDEMEARGWLVLTANWTVLLGTIEGADFGAPNDPLFVRRETLPQFGVAIDVPRLLRAVRR